MLRESQPFRALLLTFLLQGLAAGLMLAAAQFVARWVLHDEGAVTPLFAALIAPALLMAPVWKAVADRLGKERSFRLASLLFLLATLVLLAMIWAPGWWILAPVCMPAPPTPACRPFPWRCCRTSSRTIGTGPEGSAARACSAACGPRGRPSAWPWGAVVLSLVLALTGYVESTAGTAVAQSGTAVLMAASLVALSRYRLREHDIEGTAA